MPKQTLKGKLQAELDQAKEARNANNGFKNVESAGTNGLGGRVKNKR